MLVVQTASSCGKSAPRLTASQVSKPFFSSVRFGNRPVVSLVAELQVMRRTRALRGANGRRYGAHRVTGPMARGRPQAMAPMPNTLMSNIRRIAASSPSSMAAK